jgi:hypothetical protein
MKTIPVAAGVVMVLALAEPGVAADPVPRTNPPCPILRPMARCSLEGRRIEAVVLHATSRHVV